ADMVAELLGDPEALRELYVELTDHPTITGEARPASNGKPAKPNGQAVTADKIAELVAEGVRQEISKLEARAIEEAKVQYTKEVRAYLEGAPKQFPHCFSAPPSDRAITAISDAVQASTGKVPDVETVL